MGGPPWFSRVSAAAVRDSTRNLLHQAVRLSEWCTAKSAGDNTLAVMDSAKYVEDESSNAMLKNRQVLLLFVQFTFLSKNINSILVCRSLNNTGFETVAKMQTKMPTGTLAYLSEGLVGRFLPEPLSCAFCADSAFLAAPCPFTQ